MNIVGDRVILRALEIADAQMLLELINDPETERMLGGFSFPVSLDEQVEWIRKQAGRNDVLRCTIVEKEDTNRGLGTIVLSNIDYKNATAQVHIKLAKDEGRGRGIGADSLRTILKYAFNELRLNCIAANVLEYNVPSQRLFEKCGFKRDGVLRARIFKEGSYHSQISYSILQGEWDV